MTREFRSYFDKRNVQAFLLDGASKKAVFNVCRDSMRDRAPLEYFERVVELLQ
jgi:hypothetical protein